VDKGEQDLDAPVKTSLRNSRATSTLPKMAHLNVWRFSVKKTEGYFLGVCVSCKYRLDIPNQDLDALVKAYMHIDIDI
jgi:hypothetical protein